MSAIIVLFLLTLVLLFLLFFLIGMLIMLVWGAPFVPSTSSVVTTMITMANIKPHEKAADLGSGDGRFVIAFAQIGKEAHGYELHPMLVVFSLLWIRKKKLQKKAFIHWKNLLDADLSSFDVISIYALPNMMEKLEKKLLAELKPGSRVVLNTFTFPHWKPEKQEGKVYLYRVPKK